MTQYAMFLCDLSLTLLHVSRKFTENDCEFDRNLFLKEVRDLTPNIIGN